MRRGLVDRSSWSMRSRLRTIGMPPDIRRSADDESAGLFVRSGQLPDEFLSFRAGGQFAGDLARPGDESGINTGATKIGLDATTHDAAPHFPGQGTR